MKPGMTPPSAEEIKSLVNVALGNEKADMAIVNGDMVNVYTGELLKGQSIAIKGTRIAFVGDDAEHAIGPQTEIIDASGKTLVPGFIDGHTHMLWFYCIEEFIKHAMITGATTVISETIDFAFVLGKEGIVQFLESAKGQPMKIFATVASIFANGQQGYSHVITPEEFHELLERDDVMGVGESNWLPVIRGDDRTINLFADALSFGKKLEGHSAGARENRLVAYVASGVSSCHESITANEALERLRLGLHVMIREGDVRKDLEAVSGIKDEKIDFRRLAVTTDGIGARYLMEHGYLDTVVQKAIDLGFEPITAIQMATINVAEHYSIDNMVGGIAPGKYADIVIIPDLKHIKPECVISNGRIIARNGTPLVEPSRYVYPKSSLTTVHLPHNIQAADFTIQVDSGKNQAEVRVIDLSPNIMNKEAILEVAISEGEIKPDTTNDILKVAAIDRADGQGKTFVGLVRGFGLKKGAFAATANWDVANILVVGATEEAMAGAVNRIRKLQGGAVVFADGAVQAELPMPIAGCISDLPMEEVAQGLENIQREMSRLGCRISDPHLMLTTLTTPILPSLRISTDGLIEVKAGKLVDLLA